MLSHDHLGDCVMPCAEVHARAQASHGSINVWSHLYLEICGGVVEKKIIYNCCFSLLLYYKSTTGVTQSNTLQCKDWVQIQIRSIVPLMYHTGETNSITFTFGATTD